MSASSSDKISESSNGGIPAAAHVTGTRAAGVTTLAVDTQQYWPIATGVKFSTYKVDTNNNKVAGSQTDWEGVSNGSNSLTNIVVRGGAADAGNAIGDLAVMMVSASWGEDMAEAFLQEHTNPSGAHGAINASGLITANAGIAIPSGQSITGNGYSAKTLYNPYKFRAIQTAAFNFATSFTIVKFDTKDYDTGTNYTVASGLFTAPVAGFYHFDTYCRTLQSSGGHRVVIQLVKNGTVVEALGSDGSGAGGVLFFNGSQLSDTIQLALNDTIQVQAVADTVLGADVTQPSYNRFSGNLVSGT